MADEASVPESAPAASRTHSDERVETLSVRRAPKISVFLLLGAFLGVVVALILTLAFDDIDKISPNTGVVYAPMQVFGFLALIFISVGLIVGGSIALIFDRRATRNAHDVTVTHSSGNTD